MTRAHCDYVSGRAVASRSSILLFIPAIYTERYRSGHNGADSKSVWAQAHVGSNPTLSAKQGGHPREGVPALFDGDEAPLRTHRVCAAERRKLSFHALLYSSPFLFVGREMAGSNARDKSRALRRIPSLWSLPAVDRGGKNRFDQAPATVPFETDLMRLVSFIANL